MRPPQCANDLTASTPPRRPRRRRIADIVSDPLMPTIADAPPLEACRVAPMRDLLIDTGAFEFDVWYRYRYAGGDSLRMIRTIDHAVHFFTGETRFPNAHRHFVAEQLRVETARFEAGVDHDYAQGLLP